MNISDHIPPALFKNINVRQFADVLDATNFYKNNILYRGVSTIVNPLLQGNSDFLRKFLVDAGNLPNLYGIERMALENFIMNAYDIFSYKGTPKGICLYLRSLLEKGNVTFANTVLTYSGAEITCLGVTTKIVLDFSGYWGSGTYLRPDDFNGFGLLPNGTSLGIAASTPELYPYLFGGQDFNFYYKNILIKIYSDFLLTDAYRNFIKVVIYKFLSMVSEATSTVTIQFFQFDATPITDIETPVT